jgi:hypothetical protein
MNVVAAKPMLRCVSSAKKRILISCAAAVLACVPGCGTPLTLAANLAGIGPTAITVSLATQGTVTDLSAGQSIAAALANTTAGNTLSLGPGSYKGFTTSQAATGGTIRIVAAMGATVNIMGPVTFDQGSANKYEDNN